jgi:hypothetical protein
MNLGPKDVTLRPLTAEYEAEHHAPYVGYIEQALEAKGVHNIALTGSYGTGKSSILKKVSETHGDKALTIALSTLSADPADRDVDTDRDGVGALSGRIQREIVKQLLYRERPAKVRRSNYRRVGKFKFWTMAGYAALATGAVSYLLWATGVLQRAMPPRFETPTANVLFYALAFAVVTASLTFVTRMRTPGFSLKGIGAAGASLSLEAADVSFDKHLEEILFFFEVTKVDIVIFEDIDRFDNASIFEPLRELNVVLNSSLQVGRPIRFIYAIKDSVFDELGTAITQEGAEAQDAVDAELARANRTKFFDWVIPIVPFITQLNARDLMHQLFTTVKKDWQVTPELLDLVAEHLTDMRLMKNTVNEYEVFASQLLTTVPGITPDHLFALVVYKNIHLTDFERITKGKSDLHRVYRASRSIKTHQIPRLEKDIANLDHQIADGGSLDTRARHLGTALHEHLDRIAGYRNPQSRVHQVSVGSTPYTLEQLTTPAFWKAAAAAASIQVQLTPNYSGTSPLTPSLDDLRAELGDPINPAQWAKIDVARLQRQRRLNTDRVPQLQHADFHELATLFWATIPVAELTEDRLPPTVPEGATDPSFSDLIDATLQSDLARKLVRRGHITEHFALYAGQYYDTRVPRDARQFLMQHVDPGIPDIYATFSSDAAMKAVLATRPDILDTSLSNNIAIVDYVTEHEGERLTRLAKRLAPLTGPDQEFIDAYLPAGTQQKALIRAIASDSPHLPNYLVSHAQLGQDDKVALMSEVIAGADDDTVYETDPTVADFIEQHYATMPVFTQAAISETPIKGLVALLSQLDVRLPDVTALHQDVLAAVAQGGLYQFTRTNLAAAIGGEDLALDHIRATSEDVYDTVLANIDAYAELPDIPKTVTDPAQFVSILEDIPETASAEVVDSLIQRTDSRASVKDLADSPSNTWTSLLAQGRSPVTFGNIAAYLEEFTSLTPAVGAALAAAGSITDVPSASDDSRSELAITLIHARDAIPDPAKRTELAVSLDVKNYLDVDKIRPEDSTLLGDLIAGDLVADDAATFRRFADAGWTAVESGLRVSPDIKTFITPDLIREEHLPRLFASREVPTEVKTAVIQQLRSYAPDQADESLNAAISYATMSRLKLSCDTLGLLAESGQPGRTVIPLLVSALDDLTNDKLVGILQSLEDPYPQLTVAGKKKVRVPYDDDHAVLGRRLNAIGLTQRFNPPRGLGRSMASLTHS